MNFSLQKGWAPKRFFLFENKILEFLNSEIYSDNKNQIFKLDILESKNNLICS